MATREQIREGMYQIIMSASEDVSVYEGEIEIYEECVRNRTKEALKYLHSQGVMIKIKCPDCCWSQFKEEHVGMTPCHSCNSTGYIVKSLEG